MQLSIQIFVSIFDINAFGGRFFHLYAINIIDTGFLSVCHWYGMNRSEVYLNLSHQFSTRSSLQPTGIRLLSVLDGIC